MSNRKLTVKYQNVASDLNDVNLGVPQGSVLGPVVILFIHKMIFLNMSMKVISLCMQMIQRYQFVLLLLRNSI